MYLARSQTEALVLALLCMVCWGSWSNTVVWCGSRLRFELYYVNYVMSILATALLAAVTLGMISISGYEPCALRFIPDDLKSGDRFCVGMAAGAIFNLANMMLTKGIQMCGLAVAFPLCIGTALVFGTLLTHFLEGGKDSEPALLFTGVAVAFVAVCFISLVHRLKDAQGKAVSGGRDIEKDVDRPQEGAVASSGPRLELPSGSKASGRSPSARSPRSPFSATQRGTAEERSPMAESPAPVAPPAGGEAAASSAGAVETVAVVVEPEKHVPGTSRKLMVCIAGGVLMSFWAPLNALAQEGFATPLGRGLSPYGGFLAFCVGTFLSTLPLIPLVLTFPLEGGPRVPMRPVLGEYRRASCEAHAYGLLGGFIWAIGTLLNSVSGQQLSFAASYAIGQSAPMISILWGVFLFKEFNGATATVKALLVLVCALYVIAIALIAASH